MISLQKLYAAARDILGNSYMMPDIINTECQDNAELLINPLHCYSGELEPGDSGSGSRFSESKPELYALTIVPTHYESP